MHILKQDGKVKGYFNTENDALAQLHKAQPFSWDYAFKYGGWGLIEVNISVNDLVDCIHLCARELSEFYTGDQNEAHCIARRISEVLS
jgi:hypothetical protein